jgi:dTDP-4-amino-4,6-dideoxygalactose transaminase
VALSVRSAFDAAIGALDWPAGTIILMSAINIADMGHIVKERGFQLVPLAVDPDTLAPDPHDVIDTIQRLRARPKSAPIRALCLAHLFGSRVDLSPFVDIARDFGLQLWEDAAQAFCPRPSRLADRPDAVLLPDGVDLSLTSFGLIKTHTALGGGVAQFRNVNWCDRTKRLMESWPRQPESEFFARGVLRGLVLSLLTSPWTFTPLANLAILIGYDLDDILGGATRGFASGELFTRIRRQPAARLLDLLRRRLLHPDLRGADARARLAVEYRTSLPREVVVGNKAHFPTTWVFPIRVPQPQELHRGLTSAGFDAPRRASRLCLLQGDTPDPHPAATWLDELVFLPLQAGVTPRHVDDIRQIVTRHLARAITNPKPTNPRL